MGKRGGEEPRTADVTWVMGWVERDMDGLPIRLEVQICSGLVGVRVRWDVWECVGSVGRVGRVVIGQL